MGALWLETPARTWGVVFAMLSRSQCWRISLRPPEFGGKVALVRTVIVASVVNLGITGFLLFDRKLAAFLGSTRLVGWWSARRP